MSLISDINNKIYEYISVNGKNPISISIGINGKDELVSNIQPRVLSNNQNNWHDFIYGLKIKWVKRNNYLECLPRAKRYSKIKGYKGKKIFVDDK